MSGIFISSRVESPSNSRSSSRARQPAGGNTTSHSEAPAAAAGSTSPNGLAASLNATAPEHTGEHKRESRSTSRTRAFANQVKHALFSSHAAPQDLNFSSQPNSRSGSRQGSRSASRAASPSRGANGETQQQQHGHGLAHALFSSHAPPQDLNFSSQPGSRAASPSRGAAAGTTATTSGDRSRSQSRSRLNDAVRKVFSSHAPPQSMDLMFANEEGLDRVARSRGASQPGSRSASRSQSRARTPIIEEGVESEETRGRTTGTGVEYTAVRA